MSLRPLLVGLLNFAHALWSCCYVAPYVNTASQLFGLTAMDLSTIKVMLETQEGAYKSALDMVVKQLTDHINKLDNKVSDLVTSLEFNQREFDDLKSNAKEHEKEKKEDKLK